MAPLSSPETAEFGCPLLAEHARVEARLVVWPVLGGTHLVHVDAFAQNCFGVTSGGLKVTSVFDSCSNRLRSGT